MPSRENGFVEYDDRDVFHLAQIGILPAFASEITDAPVQTEEESILLALDLGAEDARLCALAGSNNGFNTLHDKAERAGNMAREIFRLYPIGNRMALVAKVYREKNNTPAAKQT